MLEQRKNAEKIVTFLVLLTVLINLRAKIPSNREIKFEKKKIGVR